MEICKPQKPTISEFYNERSVFFTGGTGFLGKIIVEKLLRSCPGIKNIYLLCRAKDGQTLTDRMEKLKKLPVFDLIHRTNPSVFDKIIPIEGDVTMPNLGISEDDKQILKKNVSIVIHSAATVNFNEPLKIAVNTNLRAMHELLSLSRDMERLEVNG